jgi:predicted transposase YbfD/YdcC
VLVQLKGNQPTLLQQMQQHAEQQGPSADVHHEDQLGKRNRIEYRTTAVWSLADEPEDPQWPHIRCLVQVKRHTELFDTAQGQWQSRSETAWYVCTRELSAQGAAQAVRNHWLIENALHHVRDVAMAEDASRIRRQPGVFAQLRTCALNLLRQAGHDSIKAARQALGWAPHLLLELIGLVALNSPVLDG